MCTPRTYTAVYGISFTSEFFSGGSRIFLRGGAKGRGFNNHGMGVATKYCALERKMYPGSGASPQPLFTVIMLLRRVFVVFVSSGRRKTPPLVAMNI